MYRVQNLTSNGRQRQILVLPDGTQVLFTLAFSPLQGCWFIPRLEYQNWVLRGLKITTNANMLFQFRNQIPFGLACFTDNQREPSLIEDFSSGASRLFILSEDEVDYFTRVISGEV